MPPEQFPQEKKDKKIEIVITIAVICALVLSAVAFYLFSNQKEVLVPPGSQTVPEATSTVTTTSIKKVSIPESFVGDTSMADRRVTLLELARKSQTQVLTSQEKAYILQEFGGERTALYKFSNEELQLIVDALNH